ncbi:hypothetical protein PARPLA_01569 [Rhodobacteraceae bacterium THAF1]|uniref:DUF421 domain-containing protein n=1 Tax=Palleronia sp. THAF1 TaxID=2587842 RepID=UPI000F3DE8C3|nr:YetF domain-containing protein [Palleronia sp. THAF1]QFU07655.1 hypothetical protein FIU81_03090 [Palleronia sp. THAF1]VDC23087.1 hypothetical protein PARPLA_01569 [Rhodobacteraceae bacterium THAF1]
MNDPRIDLWFNDWSRIGAIGVGALFFFVFAVLLMRVLGKRTTSQMNNFDWIITVAIGSLASSGILLKDVSIADAAFAMVVLGLCQWATTWSVIQAPWIARAVKPTPQLLVHRGEMLNDALRRERISTDELYGRLREHGYTNVEAVKWVVLETDGRMTVIPFGDEDRDVRIDNADLMGNVRGVDSMRTKQEDDPQTTPEEKT